MSLVESLPSTKAKSEDLPIRIYSPTSLVKMYVSDFSLRKRKGSSSYSDETPFK